MARRFTASSREPNVCHGSASAAKVASKWASVAGAVRSTEFRG